MTVDSRRTGSLSRSVGSVPWWTVLSLAALMAYADGFVMVALRGAFGAVERAGQPLAGWAVESTLAVPIYALAVLEVLARARRWSTPVLTSARVVIRTVVQVAFAGTLVGLLWLVATGAYDYRLQTVLGQHMTSMRPSGTAGCGAVGCADLQQNATFTVQIEALSIGLALLIVTNLVAVGWLVALRGGRVRAATAGPGGAASVTRGEAVRTLVGVGLLGTAAVQLAAVTAGRTSGAVGLVLAASEIVLAVSILVARPDPQGAWTVFVVVVTAVPLLCRSVGRVLDLGWTEAVAAGPGVPDAVVVMLEVVTLIGAVVLIRVRRWGRAPRAGSAHDRALVVLSVVALAAVGTTATTPWWTVDPGTVAHRADH